MANENAYAVNLFSKPGSTLHKHELISWFSVRSMNDEVVGTAISEHKMPDWRDFLETIVAAITAVII